MKKSLLFFVYSLFFCVVCLAAVSFSGNITGEISNVPSLMDGIKNDTYLQLVLLKSKYEFVRAGNNFNFKSDLERIPFPADGLIRFSVKQLKKGTYIVALQSYYGAEISVVFRNEQTQEPISFTISKETQNLTLIELEKGMFKGVPLTR
jgi:hypothetical protein